MEIGMSLGCFYPMGPEQAAPLAAALGVRTCEIFLNTYSELDPRYLADLRGVCDQAGLRVRSIHPFTSALENYLFFSPYPRRIADAKAFYRRYAEAAHILGASVINIHGDRGVGLESLDTYVSCLAPLMQLQEETGVAYALENVFYSSVNHPEFTARLRQKAPDVRFTLDIKQAFKSGQDPYALAEAMGDAIVNFHVNDRDDDHLCLLPGRGTVDYDRLAVLLKSYRGPGLIEVYRRDFGAPEELIPAKKFLEQKFCLQNA